MPSGAETHTQVKEFLRPEKLLKALALKSGMVVADFGCGSGFYTAAAAALVGVKGQVFALDILEETLSQTATLAKLHGFYNVSTKQVNLEKFGGSELPETSCDLVIISSLLHQADNREAVIREAYRVLKTGGRLLIVDWEQQALLGPPAAQRLSKEEAAKLAEARGFRPSKELPAGIFHYALLYQK